MTFQLTHSQLLMTCKLGLNPPKTLAGLLLVAGCTRPAAADRGTALAFFRAVRTLQHVGGIFALQCPCNHLMLPVAISFRNADPCGSKDEWC